MSTLRVALYVDTQHLWFAGKAFGRNQGRPGDSRVDYEALLNVVLQTLRRRHPGRGIEFVWQRAYCATRTRALGFTNALEHFGYTVKERTLRSPEDSFDWDTQIIVDTFRDYEERECDILVLVSGDGDFLPLLDRWPDMLVFGFPGSTSTKFPNVTYLGEEVLYDAGTE